MKTWNNTPARQLVTYKIDGIQAMLNEHGKVVSRNGKALRNVPAHYLEPNKRYEIFYENFSTTQSLLTNHNPSARIRRTHIYEIFPGTDTRLIISIGEVIRPAVIMAMFREATRKGYEGLVIDQAYKIKSIQTHDVLITDVIPGKGKHTGKMGALMTPRGRVGTGFSDAQREERWAVGTLIEVACMELTVNGKFRHARFVRRRWDK